MLHEGVYVRRNSVGRRWLPIASLVALPDMFEARLRSHPSSADAKERIGPRKAGLFELRQGADQDFQRGAPAPAARSEVPACLR